MKVWPKISLITPSLNQGKFIEQTINSVLSQNYPNLEYIIVDGGSSDNTLKILKKFKGRLRFISEPDSGQSNAINKGLKMASGEIVGFINSDDRLLDKSLIRVALVFQKNRKVLWLTGKCRIIDINGSEILKPVTIYKNFWLKHYSYTKLKILNFISQPATFWRKKLISDPDVGLFNENLKFSMDYDYWLRLGKLNKPFILNDYLAEYRMHERSKGGLSSDNQFQQEYQLSIKYLDHPYQRVLHQLHVQIAKMAYKIFRKL